MPAFQTLAGRLNVLFSREHIGDIDPEQFAPGSRFSQLARLYGVVPEGFEQQWFDYLDGIPPAISEAARAVLYSALTADRGAGSGAHRHRVPVTFAWAPGYDFELTVWDAPGSEMSPGGITMLLRSRYPADRFPWKR